MWGSVNVPGGAVGGEDKAAHDQANVAYNAANTASSAAANASTTAAAAYNQANTALTKAGDAFNKANTASTAAEAINSALYNNKNKLTLGKSANAAGENVVAIGVGANASGNNSMSIGKYVQASGLASIAVGLEILQAEGTGSIAIGAETYSKQDGSIAIGWFVTVDGNKSVALGESARVSGNYSVALGYYAATSNANSIQLGNASSLSSIMAKISITVTSDERDKTDIAEIADSATVFLRKVKVVTYVYNQRELYRPAEPEKNEDGNLILEEGVDYLTEKDRQNLSQYGFCRYDREAHRAAGKKGSRQRVGVLAQQVQNALKEVYGSSSYADLVNDNLFDYDDVPEGIESTLAMNYEGFIPFLIKAVQELDKRVSAPEGAQYHEKVFKYCRSPVHGNGEGHFPVAVQHQRAGRD